MNAWHRQAIFLEILRVQQTTFPGHHTHKKNLFKPIKNKTQKTFYETGNDVTSLKDPRSELTSMTSARDRSVPLAC